MFGVTCTCSWLELFVVIWSWVKNDAAPFLGVGGLVGGYVPSTSAEQKQAVREQIKVKLLLYYCRQSVDRFSHIRMTADDVDF